MSEKYTVEMYYSAVINGDLEGVKKAISEGFNPDIGFNLKGSAISLAIQYNHTNVVEHLLKIGVKANDYGYGTASEKAKNLTTAVKNNSVEMTELLVEKGGFSAGDALHEAWKYGKIMIVKSMLNRNPDYIGKPDLVFEDDTEIKKMVTAYSKKRKNKILKPLKAKLSQMTPEEISKPENWEFIEQTINIGPIGEDTKYGQEIFQSMTYPQQKEYYKTTVNEINSLNLRSYMAETLKKNRINIALSSIPSMDPNEIAQNTDKIKDIETSVLIDAIEGLGFEYQNAVLVARYEEISKDEKLLARIQNSMEHSLQLSQDQNAKPNVQQIKLFETFALQFTR